MLSNRQPADRASIAIGLLLVVAGVVTLVARLVNFELPEDAWPYVIIVPGLALLFVGLVVGRETGTGLTVAGSIVSTIGLVLLYQHTTGHWESWAYAWALVGPAAAGIGLVLAGLVNRDRRMVSDGAGTAFVGAALFLVGLVFFEGIIGISGERQDLLATPVLPGILVVVGLAIVARSLFFPGHRTDAGSTGSTGSIGPGSAGPTGDSGATAA